MDEPVSLQALHQAVRAQSMLLEEMLNSIGKDREPLSREEGYLLLDQCLNNLSPGARQTYFGNLDRRYPEPDWTD